MIQMAATSQTHSKSLEHTIAGPFHSQQNAITHAIDAELRVHSRWNEILPGPNRDDFGERLEDLQR